MFEGSLANNHKVRNTDSESVEYYSLHTHTTKDDFLGPIDPKMSTSCPSLPFEIQQLILENLYEEWQLRTEEVPSMNGIVTFNVRPAIQYPTSPLLANVAWREYAIEVLKDKFTGVLHVDMTSVGMQSISVWNHDRRMYRTRSGHPPPFVLTGSFEFLYSCITTLQINLPDVLMAVLHVIRPDLPRLHTIQIVGKFDYSITHTDLSFPREIDGIHDLAQTEVCDAWFLQWMNYTVHGHPFHVSNAPNLCGLKLHFWKVFRIQRLGNARLVCTHFRDKRN